MILAFIAAFFAIQPVDAAREVMTQSRYCALITIGEDGQPQARTIDPSPPDARMVVTFATNPATRKVKQIERDARVTLYYFDANARAYVTLIGTARRLGDEARQQRWLEKWSPFYPGGPASAVVYAITPRRIEVVAKGLASDPKTWMPAAVDFK